MNKSEKIEVEMYTTPATIEAHLKALHGGMSITQGSFVSDVPGYINDLEWNLYDEIHRIYVHHSYEGMYKVFSGKTFSVNVVKWGNLPLFMQVANAKIAPGLFYQTMTILGIIFVHQICEMKQLDRKVHLVRRWYTASHWLFRPLHKPFNRMLLKLQKKQDEEDNVEMRGRRLQLRDWGFRFLTDEADFTTANRLTDNAVPPQNADEFSFDMNDLSDGEKREITLGKIELIVERTGDALKVWPGLCPHEGAKFTSSHMCNGEIQCPWHGRKFRAFTLTRDEKRKWSFLNISVHLNGSMLVAQQRADEHVGTA